MVADGTPVKEGELVARFAAEQTQLELDKALIALERNALSQAAKQAELAVGTGRLDVDIAQVQSELGIAQRYAQADIEAIARNVVLDAIADERYLGEKREVLDWRKDQSSTRGDAELQVLSAQRDTVAMGVRTREGDLGALELRAPHDGVFVLASDWSGEKPQIGAQMWAGNDLATLPDRSSLEVELSLPQIEAQILALGQTVRLHPAGRPEQSFEAPISWIASAPRAVSRNSPIKNLNFKVAVPNEATEGRAWVPGQLFQGQVLLKTSESALSIPNLAIRNEAGNNYVQVWEDGERVQRLVTLGVRGPARSEVLDGLAAGDAVVLTEPTS
jgi:multidrug resistance efflux pump